MYKKIDYDKMRPIDVYKLVAAGKLKKFPNNYLDKDIIREIVRHMILKVYGYSRQDMIEKVDHKFFQDIYLGGARKFFEMKDYLMISYCFPEWDIMPWEYNKKVHNNFWLKKDNQKAFILWIAKKEGIKLKSKQDFLKITAQMINKYGGSKAMKNAGGVYNLLDSVYPGRYKEWEITKVNYWNKEKAIYAIKWLIEERLHLTKEQTCNIKVQDFMDNDLDGMLQNVCNHSVIYALNLAYPETFVRTGIRTIALA